MRFVAVLDRKSSQNELQKPPKWRPKCEKTPPETRSKKTSKFHAKLISKWSPNASPKPPKNAKKSIKIGLGAPEGRCGAPGPHFGRSWSHFGGKLVHFWTSGGTFFVSFLASQDSNMLPAKVFEEKENAATSHCFSDLSEKRSL